MRHMLVNIGRAVALVAVAVLLGGTTDASPQNDIIPGPVQARVVRVIDGDTIVVRARVWLGQEVETMIRLFGVDTPELRGACAGEKELALKARSFVTELLGSGDILLRDVRLGKYAGRVVATVEVADGRNLGRALIGAGLGHAYEGGKRAPWC